MSYFGQDPQDEQEPTYCTQCGEIVDIEYEIYCPVCGETLADDGEPLEDDSWGGGFADNH